MLPPYHISGPFRSSRFDRADGIIDLDDAIGITIHASEDFIVERHHAGRVRFIKSMVGATFVDSPGVATRVVASGRVGVFQMRLPIDRACELAADCDVALDVEEVANSEGVISEPLLRLASLSIADAIDPGLVEPAVLRIVLQLSGVSIRNSIRGLSATRLKRVHDFVEHHLNEITLGNLAKEAALSIFHFSREFRSITGETPWSYVIRRRLSVAIDLLRWTSVSIDEIARRVGFRHASHLARHMKHRLGVSPAEWRRTLHGTSEQA
jgi:AraC-like DNA-binding protein